MVCFLFLAPPAGLEPSDKVCSLKLAAPRVFLRKHRPCAPDGAQRVAKPQIQQRKQKAKGTHCVPFAFWLPLLDSNQRHPD